MMRVGSLFSGYGGLDLAIAAAFGGETVWVSDIDPGPCRVLAHHWPSTPNLGDITAIDWASVPEVDLICGGSPCTDVSTSGSMAGMVEGTRSNLWVAMREAVRRLRPMLVVWENVAGAASARAESRSDDGAGRGVEPGAGSVGVVSGRPNLRAVGRVVGDLAALGYDAVWVCLPAAGVGAPHRRERFFVLAADARGKAWLKRAGLRAGRPGPVGRGRPDDDGSETESVALSPTPRVTRGGSGTETVQLLPTPLASLGSHSSWAIGADPALRTARGQQVSLADVARHLLPTPTTQDGKNIGGPSQEARNTPPLNAVVLRLPSGTLAQPGEEERRRSRGEPAGRDRAPISLMPTPRATRGGSSTEIVRLLPTPTVAGQDNRSLSPGAAVRPPLHKIHTLLPPTTPQLERNTPPLLLPTPSAADAAGGHARRGGARSDELLLKRIAQARQWGKYWRAIERWESVVGPAPAPTILGRAGRPKLNPAFAEWMMGLPAGWVTDTPGVTDNQALRMLGNGVVPQQGIAALRWCVAQFAGY